METTTTDKPTQERLPAVIRFLNVIENVGNRLPHPFWLFWMLAGILAVLSLVLSSLGVGVNDPGTGEWTPVNNLLSGDGIAMAVSTSLDAYQSFPPLITIMVVIMGVALAERTGLLSTAMKVSIAKVPASLIVFTVAFMGTVSHVASAAAYVILVPLGGMVFKAVGRSPVLGVIVAYTSIASGYDASPIPTPNDAIFAGITSAAANIIDPDYIVTPIGNWYFNIASSILLAIVITIVTELVLTKRQNLEADEDAEYEDLVITAKERSALRYSMFAVIAMLLFVVVLVVPDNAPLRGDGPIGESPFLTGIAFIIAMIFGVGGMVYGFREGTIEKFADVPKLMSQGIVSMAPVLVLFFAIAQFLEYFAWTNIGMLVSVSSSELFTGLGLPTWVIFILVLIVLSIVNVLITSGSAMWAIMAPVIVPMLMLLDVPPETSQALFRIADSGSTSITPMSPYFILALGFMQRYQKSAGIGTLASHTLPLAVCMTIMWSLLFFLWWGLGIPLGPDAPVR
ncbi:AbgT family transporter [Brevibacterium zhoupengii]|uniref:AbgT family transporter n=1 Tax=Brevibacterium zhoupengii TaxID=2898795 RepID=UPI001E628286|nr:AbgT family transporter [Brevibacterium zhoupengii]